MTIKRKAKLNKLLQKDVYQVICGVNRLNSPHAIGYLFFTSNKNKNAIYRGKFCTFEDEINAENWDYFVDFKTDEIFKLVESIK